jgi:hypothetical protein
MNSGGLMVDATVDPERSFLLRPARMGPRDKPEDDDHF